MQISLAKFSLLSLSLLLILNYGCSTDLKTVEGSMTVKTIEASAISQTAATVSGIVNASSGVQLVSKGICYSTSASPTTADITKIDPATSTGDFSCTLGNLNPSTTYYAKAFATTASGSTYGETVSFTTQAAITPILSPTTVSSITTTGALLSGNVTHSGKSNVTSRGFCYSATVTTPTTSDTNAQAIGQVPPQLLSDAVHYTTTTRTVIGNMIYKKCQDLNIF